MPRDGVTGLSAICFVLYIALIQQILVLEYIILLTFFVFELGLFKYQLKFGAFLNNATPGVNICYFPTPLPPSLNTF
jgi:hypothetical protein